MKKSELKEIIKKEMQLSEALPDSYMMVAKEMNVIEKALKSISSKLSKNFYGYPEHELGKVREALSKLNYEIIQMKDKRE